MNKHEEFEDTSTALTQKTVDRFAKSRDVAAPPAQKPTKLEAFRRADSDPIAQNRLLFDCLSDDLTRKELYDELRDEGYPTLHFKSLLTSKKNGAWLKEDVYFVSKQDQVEAALKHYSVEPYRALDSGGEFMLGLDDPTAHDRQRGVAERAFQYEPKEIQQCARAAFQRAAVRPLKSHEFDLSDLAEQAALHFIKLLFGFRDEAHEVLKRLALGAYGRLVFQIIGRHFVSSSDSGLTPSNSRAVEKLKEALAEEIDFARDATGDEPFRGGAPKASVIKKLHRHPDGFEAKDLAMIVAGLIAGTVGNIRAAVPTVIYDFFTQKDGEGRLIDKAREAARAGYAELEELIWDALLRNPPAPFLARTANPISEEAPLLRFEDEKRSSQQIPNGAHLLLAVGADPKRKLVFGGDGGFMHNCIGARLAWSLIVEVVRQVLLLPGLSQVIEPDKGKPVALKKKWGAMSEPYMLHYQRDRRLNQQRLYVVLPIKEPVQENAKKLTELTKAGAHIVEAALRESGIVHFAWFMLVEHEKKLSLSLSTVFDGDFDAYVEHFAVKVPLFDKQFEYLDVKQELPIRKYPKQFVENIRKYNKAPLADYFYSAYPTLTVNDIKNASTDHRQRQESERQGGADQPVSEAQRPAIVAELSDDQLPEVQRLALSGYPFDCSEHLVLRVKRADKARAFLAELLEGDTVTFSDADQVYTPINVGFTYRGLEALAVPAQYLQELQQKAGAFYKGVRNRAAHRLGDTGSSAADRWDQPAFDADYAHVVVSIHGPDRLAVNAVVRQLMEIPDAQQGFDAAWKECRLRAEHLEHADRDSQGRKIRFVHFGYRDNIAHPIIARASVDRIGQCHNPGELLLGYPNDENFNHWDDGQTSADIARFFRNGSFAAFRKIEQHEGHFNEFLDEEIKRLERNHPYVTTDYLKAKLCGRWPNGVPVEPNVAREPKLTADPRDDFDFAKDPHGFGCPFSAHIRRTNPRGDQIAPGRLRPLFRRGMPYGSKYDDKTKDLERGLMGLFFCASLEDQFEHVMLEWVEKKPIGPASSCNAKDPLIGQHDEVDSAFLIPRQRGAIYLQNFRPFVTTRGTLYLLFPSRWALQEIAGINPPASHAAQPLDQQVRKLCSACPDDRR